MSQREALILGALLHDIGKFVQRAQNDPTSQDHSHWGNDWFENHLSEKLTPIFNNKEKEIVRAAINNHHEYEKFISLADSLSAGTDRIKMEDEEKGDPFTDRLISIFSRISISEHNKKDMFHSLIHLGNNNIEEAFPIGNKNCTFEGYKKLLDKFNEEIKWMNFKGLPIQQVIHYMYFLLLKYTWCIPSAAYLHEPDVSLFDHLKSTSAIASCLYDYFEENKNEELSLKPRAFFFVGGDISGIQNYIFSVLSQQGKIARRLRSRSFYVQLISEIATHKILHAFNLPLCNILSSAGGNFYMLLPNLKSTAEKIKDLQREFDTWTLQNLRGEVSLNLAWKEFSGEDFLNFTETLDVLKCQLGQIKLQPFKSILCTDNTWFTKEF